MTRLQLVLQSVRFHALMHLGTLAGAIVSSAILCGALLVGDSVRGTLKAFAAARLGRTRLAVVANDRLFRTNLAASIERDTSVAAAALLNVSGTAANADGSSRANGVQVFGTTEAFWRLAQQPPAWGSIPPDHIVVNDSLAAQLKVKKGDTILLRARKPSQLSGDAPLAPEEKTSAGLRLQIHDIVNDAQYGRFGLAASQLPPYNAFADLAYLQDKLSVTGRANLLLSAASLPAAESALNQSWRLEDGELNLRAVVTSNLVEVRTSRVFLDDAIAQKIQNAFPAAAPILTYFANELRIGAKATPYSMVTGIGAPVVPPEMPDDQILINAWLAEDLQAKVGDELRLSYYVVGPMRQLVEQTNIFHVRGIIPLAGAAADRALMPDFPGLTTAENCRDWDTGFPIKTDLIREKDEKYWHDFRGTPKAFVTLSAARKMWSSRFGSLTAIRIPGSEPEVRAELQKKLGPGDAGLAWRDLASEAAAAASQSQDFGQLFLGFSFFLIGSALLLMALLFQLTIEQRAAETGLLLAVGFLPKQVRRIFLMEGALIAGIGTLAGAGLAVFYAQAMLRGLGTIWKSAVGISQLNLFISGQTLGIGIASAFLTALLTIWWTLRKQGRQPARELIALASEQPLDDPAAGRWQTHRNAWLAAIALVCAGGLAGWALSSRAEADTFFSAGGLMLFAGFAGCSALLGALNKRENAQEASLASLGLRNATRRRKRSRAVIALIGCGVFLVASISIFRLESTGAQDRHPGTGGFALIGQSSLPVVHDLNSKAGREFYGLDENLMKDVKIVQLRVHEGDEASCLNLNRAQQPRLIGVPPEAFDQRGAFTFASLAPGASQEHPWTLLGSSQEPVNAVGDAASIQWALGKKIGDAISYVDERGQRFGVRIAGAVANSILQGNLLISEAAFLQHFPSETGYRMFLVDAPSNQASAVEAALTKGLEDAGLELASTARRLEAFNAVQNTYLNTFQVLGGLGLVLGSAGLAVILLRNVHERRAELALFLAVGFRKSTIRKLVVAETFGLLLLGMLCGLAASGVAVLPEISSSRGSVPFASVGLLLAAILLCGLLWTWAASIWATRGKILDGLRNS